MPRKIIITNADDRESDDAREMSVVSIVCFTDEGVPVEGVPAVELKPGKSFETIVYEGMQWVVRVLPYNKPMGG